MRNPVTGELSDRNYALKNSAWGDKLGNVGVPRTYAFLIACNPQEADIKSMAEVRPSLFDIHQNSLTHSLRRVIIRPDFPTLCTISCLL